MSGKEGGGCVSMHVPLIPVSSMVSILEKCSQVYQRKYIKYPGKHKWRVIKVGSTVRRLTGFHVASLSTVLVAAALIHTGWAEST